MNFFNITEMSELSFALELVTLRHHFCLWYPHYKINISVCNTTFSFCNCELKRWNLNYLENSECWLSTYKGLYIAWNIYLMILSSFFLYLKPFVSSSSLYQWKTLTFYIILLIPIADNSWQHKYNRTICYPKWATDDINIMPLCLRKS